jgi:small subunit ribosomal protein S9
MEKEVKEKKTRKKAVKAAAPTVEPQPEIQVPVVAAEKKPAKSVKANLPVPLAIATGRRKTAIAQVKIYQGKGKILLNGKDMKEYLCGRHVLIAALTKPLETVNVRDKYDIVAVLRGGGVPGQADAVRMGIARALVVVNPDWKKVLRQFGLLTRDPRMKERKKYGHKKARKSFQYSKR